MVLPCCIQPIFPKVETQKPFELDDTVARVIPHILPYCDEGVLYALRWTNHAMRSIVRQYQGMENSTEVSPRLLKKIFDYAGPLLDAYSRTIESTWTQIEINDLPASPEDRSLIEAGRAEHDFVSQPYPKFSGFP